jgi:asparagine synthase (glutamine-hydrolysing)
MCGIAGIIGRLGDENQGALRRMSTAMSHRGPDGEGFWHSTADALGQACLLAHRRLSILDLSTSASQPMVDPATGQVIAFNGEIYNYAELRGELQRAGQTFQSTGDTAVMLRALALQGPAALERLRGMFAFGLWDDDKRQLLLARDPMGMKPLYVARNTDPAVNGDHWSVAFASEVRALLASGLIARPRLNPAAVASMVWNGFVCGPMTAVRGIESLSPGQYKTFDAAGRETESKVFWDIPCGDGPKTEDETEARETLAESVRQHLASDVPLGVFLSGGIDSSAVANLAQRAVAGHGRVNTFTLAFEESDCNEAVFARKVAEAIGTQHHEITLREQHFVDQLEPALDSLDQPTFDGLNSYYISRAVREAGLTVALVGTGGDELFGGYATFRQVTKLHRLSNSSSWVPSGAKVAAARAVAAAMRSRSGCDGGTATVAPQTRWAKLPGMVADGEDLIALYQHAYGLFLPDFQDQLLTKATGFNPLFRGLTKPMYERLERETQGHTDLSAVSVMETRLFLGERLLRDTDAASMAVSLETRLPLVDRPLFESVNRVKDGTRYEPVGRKAMLRRIGLAGLDPALFERPKSGFVLPMGRWTKQRLGRVMDEVMSDTRLAEATGLSGHAVCRLWRAYQDEAAGLYWSRVWAVYVFIRWCHRHGVLL